LFNGQDELNLILNPYHLDKPVLRPLTGRQQIGLARLLFIQRTRLIF